MSGLARSGWRGFVRSWRTLNSLCRLVFRQVLALLGRLHGVRGDLATVERAHNPVTFHGSEIERILATVCAHRGRSPLSVKSLAHNNYR